MLKKEKQREKLIKLIVFLSFITILGIIGLATRSVYIDLKPFGIADPIDPSERVYKIEYYVNDILYDSKESIGGDVENIPYNQEGDYVFSGWFTKDKDGFYDQFNYSTKTTSDLSLYGTFFTYDEIFDLLLDNSDKTWKLKEMMYLRNIDDSICIELENRSAMAGTTQNTLFKYDVFTKKLEVTYYFIQIEQIEITAKYQVSYDNKLNNIDNINLTLESIEGVNIASSEIIDNIAYVGASDILSVLSFLIQEYEIDSTQLIKLGREGWI